MEDGYHNCSMPREICYFRTCIEMEYVSPTVAGLFGQTLLTDKTMSFAQPIMVFTDSFCTLDHTFGPNSAEKKLIRFSTW